MSDDSRIRLHFAPDIRSGDVFEVAIGGGIKPFQITITPAHVEAGRTELVRQGARYVDLGPWEGA
jgi:hypothetical protein